MKREETNEGSIEQGVITMCDLCRAEAGIDSDCGCTLCPLYAFTCRVKVRPLKTEQ